MTQGQARSDLGRISTQRQVRWVGTCQGVPNGRDCPFGTLNVRKPRALREARAHLRAKPTHTVELTAEVWQLVYGDEARPS